MLLEFDIKIATATSVSVLDFIRIHHK